MDVSWVSEVPWAAILGTTGTLAGTWLGAFLNHKYRREERIDAKAAAIETAQLSRTISDRDAEIYAAGALLEWAWERCHLPPPYPPHVFVGIERLRDEVVREAARTCLTVLMETGVNPADAADLAAAKSSVRAVASAVFVRLIGSAVRGETIDPSGLVAGLVTVCASVEHPHFDDLKRAISRAAGTP